MTSDDSEYQLHQPARAFILSVAAATAVTPFSLYALAGTNGGQQAEAQANPIDFTDQIIVRYKASLASASQLRASATNNVRNAVSGFGFTATFQRKTAGNSLVWKLDRSMSLANATRLAEFLQGSDASVEFAHPDTRMRQFSTPTDPYFPFTWGYLNGAGGIELPTAWDISTGLGTTVAIIDSGYTTHEDLAGKFLQGHDFIRSGTSSNDGNGRDADARDPGNSGCGSTSPSTWHGTQVAGVVSANVNNGNGSVGVAYASKLLPVRVLGACGGYSSDIADGIRWAAGLSVAGVPNNINPAKILNLSFGGPGGCSGEIQSAVSAAQNVGALVVAAAGNDNVDAYSVQPANCPGVLAVAASDRAGGKASFSNFGSVISLAAPGVEIVTTSNAGQTAPANDLIILNARGTSFAAPHVSGVAALISTTNPYLSGDQVADVLKLTTKPFAAYCNGCGSGILNAKGAVDAALRSRTQLSAQPKSVIMVGYGGIGFTRFLTIKNSGTVVMVPTSISIDQTSGSVESLSIYSDQCIGRTLNPGTSCPITMNLSAGCGPAPTSSTWNFVVAATGASSALVVPVTASSLEGVCY